MSKKETPMLVRYWQRVGGILIEEFPAVKLGPGRGPRSIDGIIIHGPEIYRKSWRDVEIRGQDITVVQVKASRLGMNLMGQAFFSMNLMSKFEPASMDTVALCNQDDEVLRPIFESYPNCKVVVLDAE